MPELQIHRGDVHAPCLIALDQSLAATATVLREFRRVLDQVASGRRIPPRDLCAWRDAVNKLDKEVAVQRGLLALPIER